jgi:hypothetical protein
LIQINFQEIAMGPFPHDAPAATISADNPMGTDGFEFVEYAHPKPEELHALFKLMGYAPVARHKTKKITVYRQGDINYLVNEEPGTHGHGFVAAHGPCAPSMAFRVVDAKQAYERALSLGAEATDISSAQKTLDVPAIKGIGGSLLVMGLIIVALRTGIGFMHWNRVPGSKCEHCLQQWSAAWHFGHSAGKSEPAGSGVEQL